MVIFILFLKVSRVLKCIMFHLNLSNFRLYRINDLRPALNFTITVWPSHYCCSIR